MTTTAFYASLLGLLYLGLTVNVIRTRRATGVSLGDGGNELLQRRVRAHGNFAETVPIALILVAFAEAGGAAAWMVHTLGVTLVVGRAMHGFALSSLTRRPVARTGGMAVTLTVIGTAALTCLALALR